MDEDGDGKLDPQGFTKRFWTAFEHIIKCVLIALPAAAAWLIVGLLRGELYTCAVWPKDISCPHGENGTMVDYYVPACEVGVTEGVTEFTKDKVGCTNLHARNLRAMSHMYAWVYIVGAVLAGFTFLCAHKSLSYFTYYQDSDFKS